MDNNKIKQGKPTKKHMTIKKLTLLSYRSQSQSILTILAAEIMGTMFALVYEV